MRVRLDYGKSGLEVELPEANLAGVLTLTPAPPLPDPQAATAAALAQPLGTRPLADLARGRRDACLVVCDITRPVPNPLLLPPILAALEAGGLPREKVTILVATGTHRPNTGAELDALLGPEIARSCRVVNHACAEAAAHRDLGMSPHGVPVRLDRVWCDADLRLTVGLIEPHFMAGWSGGRKLVMPGLAALETVQAWHSPRFLEHPSATSGVVAGNPVHEEALAIARMIPPDLIVDVTLDAQNRMTGVFAGAMEAAWQAGVAFAERHCRALLPAPVDVVVTTCAGHPLDATFYQGVKGLVGALPAVKPGGSIVLAAECAEGLGGPHFVRLLREWEDLEAFTRAIQQPGWAFVPDQWEVEELAKAARQNTLYAVCSGLPLDAPLPGVTRAATVEAAVAAALARSGPDVTLAVIPKGPYVIPGVA